MRYGALASSSGASSASMRVRVTVVDLLLDRTVLVPAAATNLPLLSRFCLAEGCSLGGASMAAAAAAGGEARKPRA